jgi:hypothetical protein
MHRSNLHRSARDRRYHPKHSISPSAQNPTSHAAQLMAGVSPARSRSPYHDRLMVRSSPAQHHNPPIDPASPSRNRSSPPIDPTGVVQRTPIEPSGRFAECIDVAVSAFAVPSVITGGAGETVVCSLVSRSDGSSGLHIAKEGDGATNKGDDS